jgi:hypothetical protein
VFHLRSLCRTASAVGAAALAAVLVTAGPAPASAAAEVAPDVIITQVFAADSGEVCPLGVTRGTLGWHVGIGGSQPIVDVKGVVDDRGPISTCGGDVRYTTAIFTAYSGNVVVDSEVRRADDGQQTFSFSLTARTQVSLVIVQVCRPSLTPGPFEYCGPPQKYRTPVAIAG